MAVDSPREPRLSPDGRRVAYTAEAGGARQVFVLDLRSGPARQVTASEHAVERSRSGRPTGRGSPSCARRPSGSSARTARRPTLVADHPAGQRSPRWAPDGRRIAFVSRRRGWSQAWLVDAPLPRRGRPPAREKRPEPRALTPDRDRRRGSPLVARTASRLAVRRPARPGPHDDAGDGRRRSRRARSGSSPGPGPGRPARAGSRTAAACWSSRTATAGSRWSACRSTGAIRTVLTSGRADHGDYNGGFGAAPLPSPDGTRFVHSARFATGSSTCTSRRSPAPRPRSAVRAGRRRAARSRSRPGAASGSARRRRLARRRTGCPTAAGSSRSARPSATPRTSGSSRSRHRTGRRRAVRDA